MNQIENNVAKNDLRKKFMAVAHAASIEIQFAYYQSYIRAGSKVFEDELKKYEAKLAANESQNKPKDMSALFVGIFNSIVHSVSKEKIPHYFRTSSFLFLFSALEGQVKEICDVVHKATKNSENINEFKSRNGTSNVSKSKKYLNKYIQLEIEYSLWDKIDAYQKIRNSIIHNNSNIIKKIEEPMKQQPLYTVIKKDQRLSLDTKSGNFIINTDDYLIDFSQTAKEYLLLISEQIFKKNQGK
jgi:hypothetical protein